MNKTVTANISGIVFHIEVDAYEKLNNYLNTIKSYFKSAEGADEIMADIEARIAELLKAGPAEVVNMNDVNHIIETMGEPEQYIDEDAEPSASGKEKSKAGFMSKRLFRDPDDNVIGGVCSGLGYYFGIDRIWFRVAFLIALFGFGTGIFVYLILWIIIPIPKTTAEKLEMKGEPVNIENIGNTIKEEFESLKKKVDDVDGKGAAKKIQNGFLQVLAWFGNVLYYLLKFISKIFAFALLIVSISLLIVLLFTSLLEPSNFQINDVSFQAYNWIELAQLFNSNPQIVWITLISLFLFVLIPILSLIYFSLRVLFKFKFKSLYLNSSLLVIWIASVVGLFVGLTFTTVNYSSIQEVEENFELVNLKSDTILLKSNGQEKWLNKMGVMLNDDKIKTNDLTITIVQSADSTNRLKVFKNARGRNKSEAKTSAEAINIEFELVDQTIILSPYISTNKENGFRFQNAEIQLAIPVGKTVYLDYSVRKIIYDIKNSGDVYDGDMINHYWLMTSKGLKCTDC